MNRGDYSKTNTRRTEYTQNTAVALYRCYRRCFQVCPTISTQYSVLYSYSIHQNTQQSTINSNNSITSSTVRSVPYTSTRVLSTGNGIVLLLISIAAYVITLQRYVSRKYTLLRSTKYYVKNSEGNTIGEF